MTEPGATGQTGEPRRIALQDATVPSDVQAVWECTTNTSNDLLDQREQRVVIEKDGEIVACCRWYPISYTLGMSLDDLLIMAVEDYEETKPLPS